jgi:phosphatidylglycerophosphatase A
LFDILKPPPARQLERLPDGLGIMADDLAAAVFAWAGLKGLMYLGAV